MEELDAWVLITNGQPFPVRETRIRRRTEGRRRTVFPIKKVQNRLMRTCGKKDGENEYEKRYSGHAAKEEVAPRSEKDTV